MSDYTNFIPKRRLIADIDNAQLATVTTSEDHGFDDGDWIRLIVPPEYGMSFDYTQARVVSVPSDDTFIVAIDTLDMDAFVVPVDYPYIMQPAQVVPMSGVELNNTSITGPVI